MTAPAPSPGGRPARARALAAGIVATVAAAIAIGVLVKPAPIRAVICRQGDVVTDSSWPHPVIVPGQLVAHIVAASGNSLTDTTMVVDSAFWASVDSAQLAQPKLIIVAPCETVVPRAGVLGDSG